MPFGRGQGVLVEQLAVQVRQLDGVGDGLDLAVEAADVVVGDVGDLFEHELFDLLARQLLDEEPGAQVHEHRVARAHLHVAERVGDLGHALLVTAPVDEGAAPVVEHLLQRHDLAGALRVAGLDDVQRLVEHDLVAAQQLGGVEVRVQGHAHLPARGEHVDGAVGVDAEERPVGRGGLGELLDLFAKQGELLFGLLQGVGELLVLRHGLLELAHGSRGGAPRAPRRAWTGRRPADAPHRGRRGPWGGPWQPTCRRWMTTPCTLLVSWPPYRPPTEPTDLGTGRSRL